MMLKGNRVALVCMDDRSRVLIPRLLRQAVGFDRRQPLVVCISGNSLVIRKADLEISPVQKKIRRLYK